MTASAFLGNSATLPSIEHEGRTYRVRRLDLSAMEAYSAWFVEWTRKRLVTLYGHDQALLSSRLAELEKDVLAGVYEFEEAAIMGEETWAPEVRDGVEGQARSIRGGVLHTHRGRVALVAILVGCTSDEALALITSKPAEMGHLLNLVLKESFSQPKAVEDWRPLGNASTRPAEQAPAA